MVEDTLNGSSHDVEQGFVGSIEVGIDISQISCSCTTLVGLGVTKTCNFAEFLRMISGYQVNVMVITRVRQGHLKLRSLLFCCKSDICMMKVRFTTHITNSLGQLDLLVPVLCGIKSKSTFLCDVRAVSESGKCVVRRESIMHHQMYCVC